jgi:uncharacterized protein
MAQAVPDTQELLKRAEAADTQAQFELGRAYEDGKGVPQDDERAVEWFRKSAEHGNAQAQNSLGVMYAQGRGVQRDRAEAVRWYRKAAKQGLPKRSTTLPSLTTTVKEKNTTPRWHAPG